jgi:hypothetical protein
VEQLITLNGHTRRPTQKRLLKQGLKQWWNS